MAMANIAMQCAWADSQLQSNESILAQLPQEILEVILASNDGRYFDTLARAALIPNLTDHLFILYEPLMVEIAARWCHQTSTEDAQISINVLATFARILPAKPCLKVLLKEFIETCKSGFLGSLAEPAQLMLLALDVDLLSSFLVALFRLYSHDMTTYSRLISPVQLSSLLGHEDPSVRYLTVRCLALYMKLADAMVERIILEHVPEKGTTIKVDGAQAPARLFSLWEEQRWRNLVEALAKAEHDRAHSAAIPIRSITAVMFSPNTAVLAGVLVPRSKGNPTTPSFVDTPTTTRNFVKLANAILNSNGILLSGASGSGKTLLVNEAAKLLNKLPYMITLHLNEQTDAKSLLGIYTTSPSDGSFIWQPGVLSQAMAEGRWVLIEDVHRASPEVMGVILPILEHGEILVPGRNETIRTATGFCILATTTESALRGSGSVRSHHRWNSRFWNVVEVEPLQSTELELALSTLFPILKPRIFPFLSVHDQVQHLFEQQNFRTSRVRTPDLRDLLTWCRRSQSRLVAAGLQTGAEPVDENILDSIFKDAVTCYAGHIPSHEPHLAVAKCIAEVLQIPPKRMRHCVYDRLPSLREEGRKVIIGRASCPIINSQVNDVARSSRRPKSAFALTRGTLKTMEEIAAAVEHGEPTLLVGETGIGKTATIQHLATLVGQKLSVFNLSQQSESGDLLGGFKPVTTRSLAIPMSETFDLLFDNTFSLRKNAQFQASIRKCISKGNWTRLASHWQEAVDMADNTLRPGTSPADQLGDTQPNKRRKLQNPKYEALRQRWHDFATRLSHLKAQACRGDKNFAMTFVEGKIVQALRDGEWVLLDEINLATPETLESVAELLYNHNERAPSLLLSESGKMERVDGHRNFHIFAAMNPATDSGKRDLPAGIRSRFTEIFVQPSDKTVEELTLLISTYLGTLLTSDEKAAFDLAKFYLEIQKMNGEKRLTDGAGQAPHFSIRSLVRTLIYTNQHASIYGLRRALYEGSLMSFTTMLSVNSQQLVNAALERCLLGGLTNVRSLLSQNLKTGANNDSYVVFKHHLVKRGNISPERQPHYIITPFVERNLLNLARAVSVRRFPILLQGPTSAGKTSMVEHLAKVSGNEFIRINNHEHTDLQEYLGSYASGEDGKLQYREGVLVEALRRGQWIVLDELNLAPTDVLEALNRLLDDNRELFIPETQETVKPHPNFVLFATQNPAGLYGGRKHLSRAFRNRFLELHFDDIPEDELEFILKERTQIAPSFCTRIVSVYKRLAMMRQSSRLFEQRNSFATLRDLFRWASRRADDREQLALNGFMLLAERVRDPTERMAVKQIIEEVMKVQIHEEQFYSLRCQSVSLQNASGVIWTPGMQRLLTLVMSALENNEPVLLVGETGSGKTQICQTVAEINGQRLHMLNAHSNTETGDLIGAQRPVRNKAEIESRLQHSLQSLLVSHMNGATESASLGELIDQFERADLSRNGDPLNLDIKASIAHSRSLFQWADGSLVVAMKRGEPFLLDEISLAEDSVLERLNSVLEPSRSILLAEKGPDDSFVRATPGFHFLATMNPGGDYGKRELSSALRNRLTEIWVSPLSEQSDVLPILQSKLGPILPEIPHVMIEFAQWFRGTFHTLDATSVSLRGLLTWVDFVRLQHYENPHLSVLHGAALVFIDALGANPAALTSVKATNVPQAQRLCLKKLGALLDQDVSTEYFETPSVEIGARFVQCGSFRIPCGTYQCSRPDFVFDAPTTRKNALRILRALQLPRPVLLEGDPGVGKTALVEAVAQAACKKLTRINLSDQTDLTDLFGSDVPVEGGLVGNFSWRDGPFLRAMENGEWVLLDEMNLATQSVLEGLNSCFDHRQQIYIAELDRTFVRHPDFVLFATQNPHHQGGGRKGLPTSFVNRFTVVYADALTQADLIIICQRRYKGAKHDVLHHIISAVLEGHNLILSDRSFDSNGGPWEVNLRDIDRWFSLYNRYDGKVDPSQFHDLVISQRFRTRGQRDTIRNNYAENLRDKSIASMFNTLSSSCYQLGLAFLKRNEDYQPAKSEAGIIPTHLLPYAESLIHCINQKWPTILVGDSGSGKSTVIRKLAALHGARLVEFSVSEDLDTVDLLGGFEQLHQDRAVSRVLDSIRQRLLPSLLCCISQTSPDSSLYSLLQLYHMCNMKQVELKTLQATLAPVVQRFPTLLEDVNIMEPSIIRKFEAQEPRFGWIDGVLVEAVVKGHWLVLDNANTCNSAVLDRLNSLLEPNGCLIVSEQHEGDGSPRIIRPHNDFRIFLTMDPRRGELSRAMRNRSVEICLQSTDMVQSSSRLPSYSTEAASFQWRRLQTISLLQNEAPLQAAVTAVCADHLSLRECLWSISSPEYELLTGENNNHIIHELAHYHSLPDSLFKRIQNFYNEMAESCPGLEQAMDDQPLHAESNEPLIQMTGDHVQGKKAAEVGWLLESFLTLSRTRKLVSDTGVRAPNLPVSDMTILERSIVAQRDPHRASNMVQPVSRLVESLISAADETLTSLVISSCSHGDRPANSVNAILNFLKDVVDMSRLPRMRAGLLPIYVQLGEELFSRTSSVYPATAELLKCSLAAFGTHIDLRYGRSLTQLWRHWRPRCAANSSQLDSLLKLDYIMQAFDIACRKVRFVRQMVNVQRELSATRNAILDGSDNVVALLAELQTIISSITPPVEIDNEQRTNYFAAEFEALCQYQDLDQGGTWDLLDGSGEQSTRIYAALLAGRSTKHIGFQTNSNLCQTMFSRTASFAGWSNPLVKVESWKQTFAQDLLQRLSRCRNEPLQRLDSLTEELSWLSSFTSESTRYFSRNQVGLIREELVSLIRGVVLCHQDLLKEELRQPRPTFIGALMAKDIFHESVPTEHHFRHIWEIYLYPALSLATSQLGCDQHKTVGAGLVYFALASLQLWVPDRPTDPALALIVQREQYQRRKTELETKLQALKIYASTFSGQETSLRIRRLEQEIGLIGKEPPPPPVVRLEDVNLLQVQAEFSNVLISIVAKRPETILLACVEGPFEDGKIYASQRSAETDLLRRNIEQMIQRLSQSPHEYDDLTVPVVHLLQILDLGAKILEWSGREHQPTQERQAITYIVEHTPLLGATPASLSDKIERHLGDGEKAIRELLHLQTASVVASVSPRSLSDPILQAGILSSFESCFAEWKAHLEVDQSKEAQRAKYYEYRGHDVNENVVDMEEVKEIFPTFDGDVIPDTKVDKMQNYDSRVFTLKVAKLHASIFSPDSGGPQLKRHILLRLDFMALLLSTCDADHSFVPPLTMLPALVLHLNEQMQFFEGGGSAKEGSIYVDPNVNETRKLLSLVHRIGNHVHTIAEMWPEHALPQDILACCHDILRLPISDPLAKLFTKTERLLSFLNEWQIVASREYSVVPFIDELTALIISWRRLELSSWSRLLVAESSICEEDAKLWWFMVYEIVISIPLRLIDEGNDCASHSQDLVGTLIKFLQNSRLGQYSPRLRILENFRNMTEWLMRTGKPLGTVDLALLNVIEHFKRYEPIFQKTLLQGREKLEYEVREQIKLASWKDTNVTTLRESARRSHYKLFKIVKRYRALLAQPIEHFSAPDVRLDRPRLLQITSFATLSVDKTLIKALRVVEQDVDGWDNAPRRLREPRGAAESMLRLYESSQGDLDVGSQLYEYVRNLTSAMTELRSETPSKTDGDSRALLLHLKARKRRLLADVLKDVRHMGIRRNLNTQELERQQSLNTVLGATTSLNDYSTLLGEIKFAARLSAARDCFHGVLDLMDRARKGQEDGSEDLTSSEVGRCIGSLEGFLLVIQNQRHALDDTLKDLTVLQQSSKRLCGLHSQDGSRCVALPPYSIIKHGQLRWAVSWLPQILEVACSVLQIQVKHSEKKYTDIINSFNSYQAHFKAAGHELKGRLDEDLPECIQSHQACVTIDHLQSLLAKLRKDLDSWIVNEPDAAYLLMQLLPWTDWSSVSINNVTIEERSSLQFDDFKSRALAAVDKVFVSMQRHSGFAEKLPKTVEDAKWLVHSDEILNLSIRSFHIKEVATEISDVMNSIATFEEDDFQKAISLCVVFTPIFTQFLAICEHAVERYANLHAETCGLAYILVKSFNQIASEGFCGPADGLSTAEESTGQLEQGVGLAEGEAAEDISKDIADDEELSELAEQQREEGSKEEIHKEENAVDMGKDDLQGEMDEHGEADDKIGQDKASDSENSDEDMDEETGSVDNLDPLAVDEKMWEGLANDREKELETEDGPGTSTNEKTAASDKKTDRDVGPEEISDEHDEEGYQGDEDNINKPQADNADPHLKQDQALELPEGMQLDGDQEAKEESISNDGLDEFSDAHDEAECDPPVDENGNEEQLECNDQSVELDDTNEGTNVECQAEEGEIMEDQIASEQGEQLREDHFQTRQDENQNVAENDGGAENGVSGEAADLDKEHDAKASSSGTAPETELPPASQEQHDDSRADPQGGTRSEAKDQIGKHADPLEKREAEAFKKLGDALQKWHRQQREILQPSDVDRLKQDDLELADADFEHVENEQDQGDSQALGEATKDEARALNDRYALEDPQNQSNDGAAAPKSHESEESSPQSGLDQAQEETTGRGPDERHQESDAFIADGSRNTNAEDFANGTYAEDDLDDVKHELSIVDLPTTEQPPLTSPEEALRLWSHYSSLTHPLSLILAEQLRLILSPTQATRLRGDFRTGKRLNIKRIIPYIVSNYKRDKIWMRRSIPSKRNYQIMLAVDDSKSMTEGGAHALAFETLALLCKSLSMLEVGEVCVVSFGDEEHIRVAHGFGAPFTNESGAKIYQNFSFQQSGTNVRRLIEESIHLFRDARAKGPTTTADLWQLQLIISDGIYEHHDLIRRLVRQTSEERIMIVFVIVDSNGAKGNSIMDLTQAVFEAVDEEESDGVGRSSGREMKLKMKRYLDGFPFPYYVVVRNVADLPGVLATALKGWFREVVDVR
ncbi:hypothetical protein EPUS_07813 [Endocarpon pusillum Z07020]|uniref:Midasin n=1 Tax=Endocarpon pusillum (strain Z07020 / HMAS-L-300199) TaxID=1263415 RepID=U1HZX9_ENDPU|nr:uncharacterized protein EPUS_07813 [Endocarpon pusillum Z07020]ERF75124.1 hypothetical protein EPUS_07813 [Endocarpon pusillum Z07020]